MFQKPSAADLRRAAEQLGMKPSDDYLAAVERIVDAARGCLRGAR